jgi:hypothetical protein
MSVTASVEVYGVREALAELRKLSPECRREAVNKVKAAGRPLVALGQANYPTVKPLRGWGAGERGGRLGYKATKVRNGVKVEVGGRTPRGANAFNVVTLVQKDAAGALFDIAGLRNGASPGRRGPNPTFIKALDANYGRSQRGMWRNIAKIRDEAQDAIIGAVTEVAASTNRRLV